MGLVFNLQGQWCQSRAICEFCNVHGALKKDDLPSKSQNCLRHITICDQGALGESICNHFFPISEFSYKLIRFLLHSSIVKSDNEIGKFSYYDMDCPRRTQPITSFTVGKNGGLKLDASVIVSGLGINTLA